MELICRQIEHVAQERESQDAIHGDGDDLTYGQLISRASRLSTGLGKEGVRPGDTLAIVCANDIDVVTVFLGAADLGVMIAPLSPALPTEAIARAMDAADVSHVICDPDVLPRLPKQGTRPDGLFCTLGRTDGSLSLEDVIAAAPTDASFQHLGSPDAPYILTMTSGSTGAPKPIVLTQRSKLERARAAVALYDVKPQDIVLASTPLYHSLAERLVFVPLTIGARSVLQKRFTVPGWIECVEEHKVTFTIAVSSQLSRIANHLRTLTDDARHGLCSSLRCIVSSSAPLSESDKELVLRTLSAEFHECYGASEIAVATSFSVTAGDTPRGSVGRPAPGVDIRILREDGTPCGVNESGEIACRTPMRFAGYYKRPEQTEATLADGFFKTGDMGRLDENGTLFFQGRLKEIIICGGMNIYPCDIEQVVRMHPDVKECAAFACPDEALGEVPGIAVVPNDGSRLSSREMRRWAFERLADFQYPRRIVFVSTLPLNPMGKLVRKDLFSLLCETDTPDTSRARGALV